MASLTEIVLHLMVEYLTQDLSYKKVRCLVKALNHYKQIYCRAYHSRLVRLACDISMYEMNGSQDKRHRLLSYVEKPLKRLQ